MKDYDNFLVSVQNLVCGANLKNHLVEAVLKSTYELGIEQK